jgi:hypothetical protein
MRRVALKGLAFRKVRALLTAFAVVLGVAMVSGTYVLTDSIQRAFDGIFTGSYQDTSAVISGKQVVEFSTAGKATVPESLLQTVRDVEGVQQAKARSSTCSRRATRSSSTTARAKRPATARRPRSGSASTPGRSLQPARARGRAVGDRFLAGGDRRGHGRGPGMGDR